MTTTAGSIEDLRSQARAAGAVALTSLGKKLLVGDGAPVSPDMGADVLREAAAMGAGEAAALLAVCSAWGVAQARDANRALDYLEQAAMLGWTPAQRELQILALDSGQDWSHLRRKVSIATWTASPVVRVVRDRPRVIVIERFMSPPECEWVIERGRPTLQRAKVYRGSATPQAADARTNRETSFTILNADVLQSLLRERICSATRAPMTFLEIAKLLHYQPGQQFALHADFIQPNTPELAREIQIRGQRAATFLVYLNDDYEGGETDFPRMNFRFKGSRGDALLFSNIDPAGAPDYDTVHAGLPPTTGEKWVLSQWIRTKPVSA